MPNKEKIAMRYQKIRYPQYVVYRTQEGFMVAPEDGLIIGMPTFYQTRDAAEKRAAQLNAQIRKTGT